MERNCAASICELALNIADTLLRIPFDQTEIFFSELTTMIFRIYLALGCPYGCNEGVKSQQGNFLRIKAKNILAQLEKLQQDRFRSIFVTYVEENNPQQVLDLIHSITAFCRSEFPRNFSNCPFAEETRRHPEGKAPSYRNRFNEREKGIEGRIINATLRNLTTKLALIHDQLIQPENMLYSLTILKKCSPDIFINSLQYHINLPSEKPYGMRSDSIGHKSTHSEMLSARCSFVMLKCSQSLLGDVRMLVNFVQEQHGNPYRRVALSALLDAVDKMTKLESGIFSSEIARKDESEKSSPGGLAPPTRGDQASLRRGLFKRKEKLSHDSILRSGAEDSDLDSSPSTPRTVSSIDDGLFPLMSATILKKKSAPKLHFAFNLLKSTKTENMDEECSDSETAEELTQGNIRLYGLLVPAAKLVDGKGIFEGARRFAFLLETTRPGTFPDPPLIAALLHLASTPSATRRMHSLQRTAGRYFYQWAIQISEQLSRFIETAEVKEKAQLKMEDTMEDFFDEAIVNDDSGERCPPALQLIATLLLYEITSFLRETFKTIPRAKSNKVDFILAQVNERERRISLSTAEEDSPRGSRDIADDVVFDKKGRRIAAGRQRLLKRGSPIGQQPSLESSHKRRSLRIRKQSKAAHADDIDDRVDGEFDRRLTLAFSP
ncbi:unnamed protein product [Angiostrongylus costaricensis]|uniref:Non-specific serine/threonine protein kinase n=1 Tax=Angiostrongylus costaricensis TaxID=334426 RepID=A0A158PIK1_ANGCS|nr:unnamed protein product [Angiostrongylus costaricensis]